MSDADGLLDAVLDCPDDVAARLVLADWLEESGDPRNEARAELLRMQVERKALGRPDTRFFTRIKELQKAHPGILGALKPLRGRRMDVLDMNPTLALVLLADVVEADDALGAGSVWTGQLHQFAWSFPTTLTIRERKGNAISGDMVQDFASLYGIDTEVTFYFRGVAWRSRFVFVTYRVAGNGGHPGLYELTLKAGGWLAGTWHLPADKIDGDLTLRRKHPA